MEMEMMMVVVVVVVVVVEVLVHPSKPIVPVSPTDDA